MTCKRKLKSSTWWTIPPCWNPLPARLNSCTGSTRCRSDGFGVRLTAVFRAPTILAQALPARLRAVLPTGFQGPVVLGVRPNRFAPAAVEQAGLAGTISLMEHVGAESVASVKLGAGRTWNDDETAPPNELMMVLPDYSQLQVDQAVRLAVDITDAILFDANTGRNLATASPTDSLH